MSKENVMKFEEKVMQDESLQEKIEAAAKAYDGDKTDEKAVFDAVLAPIAKDAGLDFTYDEVMEVRKAASEGELDVSEMKSIAGGSIKDIWGACFAIGIGVGAAASDSDGKDGAGMSACFGIGIGAGSWFTK